jgi:hypothetical protein
VKGDGQTIIGQPSIDDPYAAALKQQLDRALKANADIMSELMEVKRLLAEKGNNEQPEN